MRIDWFSHFVELPRLPENAPFDPQHHGSRMSADRPQCASEKDLSLQPRDNEHGNRQKPKAD
jgi:hypothetical protein